MIRKFKQSIIDVLKSHTSDMEITLGLAFGIFIGFIPIYGFQTIAILLITLFISKFNRISALLSSQLFIPPVIPFTVGLDYIVGSLIISGSIEFIHITQFEQILLYVKPIFIGSAVVAPLMGILSGFIFYPIVKKIRYSMKHKHDDCETSD